MAPSQQPNPYAAAWPPPGAWNGTTGLSCCPAIAPGRTACSNPNAFDVGWTNNEAVHPVPRHRRSSRLFRHRSLTHTSQPGTIGWKRFIGTSGAAARIFRQRVRSDFDRGLPSSQRHRALPIRVVRRDRDLRRQCTMGGRSEPVAERSVPSVEQHKNYLGCRGEYDLLIEPTAWSNLRFVLGVGNRFWVRDLQDTVTPDLFVSGYQEFWWTFYPYIGLETKTSDDPGLQFVGSLRAGFTPLNFQYATLTDPDYPRGGSVVYPRCGFTARAVWRHLSEAFGHGLRRTLHLGRVGRRRRLDPTRLADACDRRANRLHVLTLLPQRHDELLAPW